MTRREFLERAHEFLRVAEMAVNNDCYHAAALCCYAALFWAAIAALEHVGVRQERWSHAGLRTAFREELVRKRKMYPERFPDWIEDAYDLRNDAHYRRVKPSVKKVRRFVAHAHEFLTKVKEVTQR